MAYAGPDKIAAFGALWEPPAEMVEALAKELHEAYRDGGGCVAKGDVASTAAKEGCRAEARFVLRRQHEREKPLLGALQMIQWNSRHHAAAIDMARHAYDAHAKLDAPKVPEAPTLLEAAKAVIKNSAAPFAAFDALKAAVEREEARK